MTSETALEVSAVMNVLYDLGINRTGGNVSIRAGDNILITPTGAARDYAPSLIPDHIVHCDIAGNPLAAGTPSREILIHSKIYQEMPWAHAVVHGHPAELIALSSLPGELPRVTESSVQFSKPFLVSNQSRLSTRELLKQIESSEATEWMRAERNSPYGAWILVQRHGVFVIGTSLSATKYFLFKLIENADVFMRSKIIFGERLDA